MPIYTIQNVETDETKEVFMKYEDYREFLESNEEWKEVLSTPKFVTSTKTNLRRADDGYKDLLKNIKKHSGRNNTIKV